jgi:hypothetical protein
VILPYSAGAGADVDVDDEDGEGEPDRYRAAAAVDLATLVQRDAGDESLRKYKASLLGAAVNAAAGECGAARL